VNIVNCVQKQAKKVSSTTMSNIPLEITHIRLTHCELQLGNI